MPGGQKFMFGPWSLPASEIFCTTRLSMALVNLKPVVPGHVLVIPKRVVTRFADMTAEEVSDMFILSQKVGRVIEEEFKAESLSITVQDGPAAGQTVAHVHVHIIPRRKGDWMDNDDIYGDIQKREKEMGEEHERREKRGPDDEDRKARTLEEMAEEAKMLRPLFEQFEDIWSE